MATRRRKQETGDEELVALPSDESEQEEEEEYVYIFSLLIVAILYGWRLPQLSTQSAASSYQQPASKQPNTPINQVQPDTSPSILVFYRTLRKALQHCLHGHRVARRTGRPTLEKRRQRCRCKGDASRTHRRLRGR